LPVDKKPDSVDLGSMTDETEREGRVVGTIPADTFAHRLILVRAERGLTLREAAEKCGLNYGSWNGWERGSMPRDRVDVVDAISEGLGIDRNWLLDGGPLTRPFRIRKVRFASLHPSVRPGVRRPRRVDGVRRRIAA
jgi:transcriptional regulator with XRE-family HTH domain